MGLAKRILLTGALTAAFTATAGLEYAREHTQTQKFTDGSRTAIVQTTDFFAGKSCSLKLYEQGEERVSENHVRFFRDNAEDVSAAKADANTWVSAPSPPMVPQWGSIPF